MKMLFLILITLFSFSAFAQKAQVTILDEDIDAEPLKKNFKVHHGSTHQSSLPNREVREQLLKEIPETKEWDELKKDIFYMDLKSKPIRDLKQKYPEISNDQFKNLKERR